MCNCDPLRSILTLIFKQFSIYLTNPLSPLDLNISTEECYRCTKLEPLTNDQDDASPTALNNINICPRSPIIEIFQNKLYFIIDQCIKLYKIVNISQRSVIISGHHSLSMTLSPEYLKVIENVWSQQFQEQIMHLQNTNSKRTFASIFQDFLTRFELSNHSTADSDLSWSEFKIFCNEKDNLNMQIKLDNGQLSNQSIRWTLLHVPKALNLQTPERNRKISIGMTEPPPSNLTKLSMSQYRKFLIASYIGKVLKKLGYTIEPEKYDRLPSSSDKYVTSIFIVDEPQVQNNLDNLENHTNVLVLKIGIVLTHESTSNSKFSKSETIESFYKRRMHEVEVKTMGIPNGLQEASSSDKMFASTAALVQAGINYDLLSSSITMELELESSLNANANEHESFIIIYNYSRLISILRKFKEQVDCGHYPSIPSLPVESTDFSILIHGTEIALIQSLLEWPRVLESTLDFYRQEININSHLKFIKELAYRFNAFYTVINVLVQPSSSHEFGLMFTRIYLLRALKNIFQEFVELILIEFDSENLL